MGAGDIYTASDEVLSAQTGIKPSVLAQIRLLADKHGIRQVILFGSRARGGFRNASDIDLACLGGDIVRFTADADELIPTALRFDVLDLAQSVSSDFRASIQTEGIRLTPMYPKKLTNYRNNLRVLETSGSQDLANEFIAGGIINKFEMQTELGLKLLREMLIAEKVSEKLSGSPRSVIKEANAAFPVLDGDLWMEMLDARNTATHIYDGASVDALVAKIIAEYIPAFLALETQAVEYFDALGQGT